MITRWSCTILAALCLVPVGRADQPAQAEARSYQVPYRLTVPKHILVRAKINNKGPFNFILDTGAPALFVSTTACKKLGVTPDKTGWGAFERFEIEGGLVVPEARGRIEDPFQLEGMNGLGLAGAELHGVLGYNILARYRIEIDFTRDKMVWTPLDFKPDGPRGIGGKGGSGGLESIGAIMKGLGGLMGRKANPEVSLRGFLGMELADDQEAIVVKSVLEEGPAGKAGLKAGDRITKFQTRAVYNTSDILRHALKLSAGQSVLISVLRDKQTKEIEFKSGEGL